MAANGIGPLVRQWVHERNETRRAARTGDGAAVPAPTTTPSEAPATEAETPVESSGPTVAPATMDTVAFSPEALARFEAWKARRPASLLAETTNGERP